MFHARNWWWEKSWRCDTTADLLFASWRLFCTSFQQKSYLSAKEPIKNVVHKSYSFALFCDARICRFLPNDMKMDRTTKFARSVYFTLWGQRMFPCCFVHSLLHGALWIDRLLAPVIVVPWSESAISWSLGVVWATHYICCPKTLIAIALVTKPNFCNRQSQYLFILWIIRSLWSTHLRTSPQHGYFVFRHRSRSTTSRRYSGNNFYLHYDHRWNFANLLLVWPRWRGFAVFNLSTLARDHCNHHADHWLLLESTGAYLRETCVEYAIWGDKGKYLKF